MRAKFSDCLFGKIARGCIVVALQKLFLKGQHFGSTEILSERNLQMYKNWSDI